MWSRPSISNKKITTVGIKGEGKKPVQVQGTSNITLQKFGIKIKTSSRLARKR